jgi:ATP-dependent Clp protease ATP-binding subunit ClpB
MELRGDDDLPVVRTGRRLDPARTGTAAQTLREDLHKRVVGQNAAIEEIVNVYQSFLVGMASPRRPIGSFLFLGPTGCGKTRMVEALADSLVGDERAVVKIDCAEFQHSHEIAKLIGSPPGYLGHRETSALLSPEALNQYHTEQVKLSFVLFDEIEKASDALWNLLLGILDKAVLTLGDNRRVDFSQAIVFMTSNLGAAEMSSLLNPRLGFAVSGTQSGREPGMMDRHVSDKISRVAVEAARRKFTPEFMNRIDKVVVFQPLGEPALRQIVDLELNALQQRIFKCPPASQFVVALSNAAKDLLLREGTDTRYGARPLKRAVDRTLVHPLANLVASRQIRGGDLIRVDYDVHLGGVIFHREAEDLSALAMTQLAETSSYALPGTIAAVAHG